MLSPMERGPRHKDGTKVVCLFEWQLEKALGFGVRHQGFDEPSSRAFSRQFPAVVSSEFFRAQDRADELGHPYNSTILTEVYSTPQ